MDHYFDTAERMYDSAKLLHREEHYFNACYLAGYVYECYGKSLMQLIGYSVRSQGHSLGAFARNLQFILTSGTYPGAASLQPRYLLTLKNDCPTMHEGACPWDPGKRYDSTYNWDEATSQDYQAEMELCWNKLVAMYLDGVL